MSIKRWTAYVEDDDGNDVFVAHTPDLLGSWVRHGDHVAEVERLRAVRRALVRDNRDKTAIIRELKAALAGMVALMERSDGVASIAHGPNGYEVGCIEWGWYEEVKAVKAALAAVSAETEADSE